MTDLTEVNLNSYKSLKGIINEFAENVLLDLSKRTEAFLNTFHSSDW